MFIINPELVLVGRSYPLFLLYWFSFSFNVHYFCLSIIEIYYINTLSLNLIVILCFQNLSTVFWSTKVSTLCIIDFNFWVTYLYYRIIGDGFSIVPPTPPFFPPSVLSLVHEFSFVRRFLITSHRLSLVSFTFFNLLPFYVYLFSSVMLLVLFLF